MPQESVTFHIGQEDPGQDGAWEHSPLKAYFYWRQGSQIVGEAQYTAKDLEREIQQRGAGGYDVEVFERALARLRALEASN